MNNTTLYCPVKRLESKNINGGNTYQRSNNHAILNVKTRDNRLSLAINSYDNDMINIKANADVTFRNPMASFTRFIGNRIMKRKFY